MKLDMIHPHIAIHKLLVGSSTFDTFVCTGILENLPLDGAPLLRGRIDSLHQYFNQIVGVCALENFKASNMLPIHVVQILSVDYRYGPSACDGAANDL